VTSKRDTAEELMTRDERDEESDDDVEGEPPACKFKLSELKSHLEDLTIYTDSISEKLSRVALTTVISKPLLFIRTKLRNIIATVGFLQANQPNKTCLTSTQQLFSK
jgi:hypothetical protein